MTVDATLSETADLRQPGTPSGDRAHFPHAPSETEDGLKRTRDEQSVRALDAALRRRFSFTPSEVNVALLILEGLTYSEMAKRLGVSYHTVHTHVKAIHSKARVASNGRLQALIGSIGILK